MVRHICTSALLFAWIPVATPFLPQPLPWRDITKQDSPSVLTRPKDSHLSLDMPETTNWIVSPATIDDTDNVNSLLQTCYETLLPNNYDEDLLDVALPKMCRANPELLTSGTWYVVQHPSTKSIVGCGGWSRQSPTDGKNESDSITTSRPPHVRHVATDPTVLRQGVASALWKRIWNDMTSELGDSIQVEVYSTLTAESFYASLGFVAVEHVELPLAPDCLFPAVLMRRPTPNC